MSDTLVRADAQDGAGNDPRKRNQILEGANRVFMEQGFDAASMNDVAKAAGVSKGTLYVYFQNKEDLFFALVRREKQRHGDAIFALDPENHDVRAVLTRLGREFVGFLVHDHVVKAMRTVIAISERIPVIGREFFEDGPHCWASRLAAYLQAQVDAGVVSIADCNLAAAQFLELAQATISRPLLFCAGGQPSAERVDAVVASAVDVFLKGYAAPQGVAG